MSKNNPIRPGHSLERLELREMLSVTPLPLSSTPQSFSATPQLVGDFNREAPSFEQQTDNTWLGDALFFAADDGSGDVELWKSDGTAEGTVRVADIRPGSQGSLPRDFISIDGRVLFTAYTDAFGRELWSTDGTQEGTMIVRDFAPGLASSSLNPRDSSRMGGKLYFRHEQEVWVTDGTEAGTQVAFALDAPVLAATNDALFLAATNDAIFFSSSDSNGRRRLFVSDGTQEGTRVLDYRVLPTQIMSGDEVVYFESYGLWRSDGTDDGTYRFWNSGSDRIKEIVPLADDSAFFTTDPGRHPFDKELFYTDGTKEGTHRLRSFAHIEQLTQVGDELFFSANGQIWKSDGTVDGTKSVTDAPDADQLRDVGGTLYFLAGPDDNARELWRSDGTEAGTERITLGQPSRGQDAWVLGGNSDRSLLWSTSEDALGLWSVDHDSTDSQLLNSAISGPTSSSPDFRDLVKIGEGLFYKGRELWQIIDGENKTRIEAVHRNHDLYEAANEALESRRDREQAVIGNLHFSINRNDLWVYDAAVEQSRSVTDLTPIRGGCSYKPTLVVLGDSVYFGATDQSGNHGLWKSDGTVEGTTLVVETEDDAFPISAGDGVVYFHGSEASTGYELWKTDGTVAGTVQVADLNSGPEGSRKYRGGTASEINGRLYFAGNDGFHGYELWSVPILPSPELLGDADGNESVNFRDFTILSTNFGKEDAVFSDGDFDGSGVVNFSDFLILVPNYGNEVLALES